MLSVRGQDVSAEDSLMGVVAGSQVHAQDSLSLVAVAKDISEDAKILLEGRNLLLATITGAVLAAFIGRLLRHR